MAGKIVLFGATGFTGRHTAEAMVELGLKPTLAGRNRAKLEEQARRLGGLDFAIADSADFTTVRKLVDKGDILVSTVGPFTLYGEAALQAAVRQGAHYIDSTGEPGFIRKVFEKYGASAKSQGIALITACGYDYVPGNCAAAHALSKAGNAATSVDVGYFIKGQDALDMSQGTSNSIRFSIVEPGVTFRSGALVQSYSAERVRLFEVEGAERPAILLATTESLSLPRVFPQLRDVNVYLGWYGKKSFAVHRAATINIAFMKIPGYQALLKNIILLFTPKSSGKGPGKEIRAATGSHIVAETFDAQARAMTRAELVGANGYEFTFRILAWAAQKVSQGQLKATGAVGPVEAFGLDELIKGCAFAGLSLKA